MNVNGFEIKNGNRPYLIAEISGNHCGNINTAVALIHAAKDAGADAVKCQAYTPDTITLPYKDGDFIIKDGLWQGWTLHDLYREAHTPFEWFPTLFAEADKVDITLFASVFDCSSIDMLEHLGCPAYKIASMEIVDTPLIRYAAATGKPIIISTGMADNREIDAAFRAAAGYRNVAMLACVSSYPASKLEPALARLDHLKSHYPIVGLSDHTLGYEIAIAATAMKTAIIEKHLCLSRNDPTHDAAFSLEPDEFENMRNHVNMVWASLTNNGILFDGCTEDASRQFRRSLYVTADIKQGEFFTAKNVRSVRPGYGISPARYPTVLRRRAAVAIKAGTALAKEMIK